MQKPANNRSKASLNAREESCSHNSEHILGDTVEDAAREKLHKRKLKAYKKEKGGKEGRKEVKEEKLQTTQTIDEIMQIKSIIFLRAIVSESASFRGRPDLLPLCGILVILARACKNVRLTVSKCLKWSQNLPQMSI